MSPRDAFVVQRLALVAVIALCLAVFIGLQGCTIPKPQKGGGAKVFAPLGSTPVGQNSTQANDLAPMATLGQPENPNAPSEQKTAFEKTTEVSMPIASETKTETIFPDGRRVIVIETKPAGTIIRESVKQNVEQKVSGSWKDTAREVGAKLASFKMVQWLGALFLLGGVAMFHPYVFAMAGKSRTMQAGLGAIGLTLIFGPVLIVGNESFFLFGGIGAALLWFLVHRNAHKQGIIDANGNGIPDDQETQP